MAYPKELNNQYKQQKANGTTVATSFPQWLELQKLAEQEGPIDISFPEDVTEEPVAEVVEEPVTTVSKAQLARLVYDRIEEEAKQANKPMVRKDVIQAFMKEAALTKNGAATYYQNIQEKKGKVQHKTK